MKLSDVIALIGAGYTKAEIDALEAGGVTQETPETEAKPEPQPEPKPEPKPEQKTADTNKELLDAIASLTAAVQTRNVRESRQPIEDKPNLKDEADKVLLNLYNN